MININKDELNIYEVESLHQMLLKEFEQESVLVDMKNVNKIDMSVIQLFISTQNSCKNSSKEFGLKNVNSEVIQILKSCKCDFLLGLDNE